jgi:Mrp family chromosome partitioning ATPase
MEHVPARDSAQAVFAAESIRKHWLTVVLTVLLLAGAALGYVSVRATRYVANSTALIRPLVGNAYSPDTASSPANATVALQTEAQLVNSAAVAEQVTAHAATAICHPGNTTAAVLTNTQLVQVTFASDNAATAQLCADAYAKEYLDYRHSLAVQNQQSQLTALEHDAENTAHLLTLANADLHSSHPSADASANVRLYTTRLAALQTQIGSVQSESTGPGSVVVSAIRPGKAAGVSPALVVFAAAIVGLLLGLVLAIWRGLRKRRVVSETVTDLAGMPVLASTVGVRKTATGMPVPTIASDEAFQLGAVAVLASTSAHRAIAVASLTDGDPVAAIAFRFARGLASCGYQVVLVDAGENDPLITEVLELDEQPGVAEIVAGDDVDTVNLQVIDGVEILTAGLKPGANGPAASLPRMRDLVQQLRSAADFVVINTASLGSPSGLGQLLCADAAVLVVHDRSTSYDDLLGARNVAERMKVELLGAVVVRDPKRAAKRAEKKAAKPKAKAKAKTPDRDDTGAHSAAPDASVNDEEAENDQVSTAVSPLSAMVQRRHEADGEREALRGLLRGNLSDASRRRSPSAE